jgi:hypothetical protein
MVDNFKEKEPRKPKTKQDWEKEEAICNSMLEAIENINQQEALARAHEQAKQRIAITVDEFDSSHGNPLESDWAGFPDANALEAGTQRDVGQSTVGLHNVRQPTTGLYYTRQSLVGQHYSGQRNTVQREMMGCGSLELALAKVVGHQIMDTSITISLGELLNLTPNLTDYVKSQVFPEPTTKPTTMKMSKGQGSNVTLRDKNSVIAGTMDVDRGLPVIAVQVGKETLENVLLDGGSGVNLITEEERIRLGLPTPLPVPYRLRMADQAIVQPVGLIRNVRTHIHGILYFITSTVIRNKEFNEAYNMLLGHPWLIDAKVYHDWGKKVVTIQEVGTVKTISVN